MKIPTVVWIILIGLVVLGVGGLVGSQSLERVMIHSLDLRAEEMSQPSSMTDKLAFSRSAFDDQAVRGRGAGGWGVIGMVLLMAVIGLALLALSFTPLTANVGELIKQRRLYNKQGGGPLRLEPLPGLPPTVLNGAWREDSEALPHQSPIALLEQSNWVE